MTWPASSFRRPRDPSLGPRHGALVDALRALLERAGVPFDELGAAVRLRLGQDPVERPGKRISELAHGSRFPTARELDVIVRLCTGGAPAPRERFAGLHRAAAAERMARRTTPVSTASRSGNADGPRVGDPRNWVRLGVHAPITRLSTGEDLTDRVRAGELPGYVLREADRLQLRPVLAAAAAGEDPPVRLIVISGESAAGKTRMAAEAARAVLADWALAVPRTTADLTALHDAPEPPRRLLAWLDEVQDLLTQPGAVAALERLLGLPDGPVVLLATLRTDAENALRGTAGWRLLDRAEHRIHLHRRPPHNDELRTELQRARELVKHTDDPWIRETLAKIGDRYGIAEWLAAGPQLLRALARARTHDTDPVARTGAALVDAAIDCYRAGYTIPIIEPLLADAHRLYLLDTPSAGPDPGPAARAALLGAALAWAREPVAGATGLLVHHRGRGEQAFDYLIGHASQAGGPPIPDRLWDVLARHVTRATLGAVAIAADRHGQHALARHLADRGLAYLAASGNEHTAIWLKELLLELRDDVGLKDLVAQQEQVAARLAARRDEATRQSGSEDAGSAFAAFQQRSRWLDREDKEALLESLADAGNGDAAAMLAQLLAGRGDRANLERRTAAGDEQAAFWLAMLLFEQGDEAGLGPLADTGNAWIATILSKLLVERGDEAGLERRADSGDAVAAAQLAHLLVERGDQARLEHRADTGDVYAAGSLDELLVVRGDEDGLKRRADTGDQYAAYAAQQLDGLQARRSHRATEVMRQSAARNNRCD